MSVYVASSRSYVYRVWLCVFVFLLAGVWVKSTESSPLISQDINYDSLCRAQECVPYAE